MIDIDEIERIAKAGDPWGYAATPANVIALIAEVRALREDAERYRWLRDKANSMGHVKRAPLVLMTRDDCSNNGWEDVLIGEGLDKAIDAARGAV